MTVEYGPFRKIRKVMHQSWFIVSTPNQLHLYLERLYMFCAQNRPWSWPYRIASQLEVEVSLRSIASWYFTSTSESTNWMSFHEREEDEMTHPIRSSAVTCVNQSFRERSTTYPDDLWTKMAAVFVKVTRLNIVQNMNGMTAPRVFQNNWPEAYLWHLAQMAEGSESWISRLTNL